VQSPAHALTYLQQQNGATVSWGELARAWAARGVHDQSIAALERLPPANAQTWAREIAEVALTYARGGECGREAEAIALVEAPPVAAPSRSRLRPVLVEGLALAFSAVEVAPAAIRVLGGITEAAVASRARVVAADRLRNVGQLSPAAEVLREVVAAELSAEQARLAVDVLLEADAVEQRPG
jgi:hypothetical protein